MDSKNRTGSESSIKDDLEKFLSVGATTQQVVSFLKHEKKTDSEISDAVSKYTKSREKISKLVKKFKYKIASKYGNNLDDSALFEKGLKLATKYKFSEPEKNAFINYVLKGDPNLNYLPFQELGITDMSKFLGFSLSPGVTLDIKAQDQGPLQEIINIYKSDPQQAIYKQICQNLQTYSCNNILIRNAVLDFDKQNQHVFIHPLIVALFLPRIEPLETRMLKSNIGRLVAMRATNYIKNGQNIRESVDKLKADFALSYDIARDPNSLAYFTEDTPMKNLLKRYLVQVELYKNVLSLRSGRIFSKSDDYDKSDSISGLVRVLSSYEWTYFDSPEYYTLHDEGTMLRKLLAVFSIRPTFTQLTSMFMQGWGGTITNGLAQGVTYINTPIINVRLPAVNAAGTTAVLPAPSTIPLVAPITHLRGALTGQYEYYIENKMLVPKSRSVVYTDKMLIFYINRKYQSINFKNLTDEVYLRYAFPTAISSESLINQAEIDFPDMFDNAYLPAQQAGEHIGLRSIITLNQSVDGVPGGCSAFVKCWDLSTINTSGARARIYSYDPVNVSNILNNNNTNQLNNYGQRAAYNNPNKVDIFEEYTDINQQPFPNSAYVTAGTAGTAITLHDYIKRFATIFIYSKDVDKVHLALQNFTGTQNNPGTVNSYGS